MIVKVSKRGWSFKGAGLYYLQDKRDKDGKTVKTADRVGFTYAHNIPTDDPKRAINYMAYTAKSSDVLKKQAGVSNRGRKQKLGEVYSYSVAWHPDEQPDEQTMKAAAMESLKKLNLDKDYQALFVQHKETDHDHVHVIVNLVSLKDGKIANVGNDQVKLSRWAEEYELAHGGIICEQRVQNNEKREELAKEKGRRKTEREAERTAQKAWDKAEKQKAREKENYEKKPFEKQGRDTGIVKHGNQKIDKTRIQEIYINAKNTAEFEGLLKAEGYTLARGTRRDVLLIDIYTGKEASLSRQISGLWKRDDVDQKWKGGLGQRFVDFDMSKLGSIKEVKQRNQADVEVQLSKVDYEIDRENKLSDAAYQVAEETAKKSENPIQQDFNEKSDSALKKKNIAKKPASQKPIKERFEELGRRSGAEKLREKIKEREKEKDPIDLAMAQSKRIYDGIDRDREDDVKIAALESELRKSHKVEELEERLKELKTDLAKNDTFWGRSKGKYQELRDKLENHEAYFEKTKQTIQGQVDKLRQELLENRPPELRPANDDTKKPKPETEKSGNIADFEEAAKKKSEHEAKAEAFKEKMRRQQEQRAQERDKDKGMDLDI